MKVTFKSEEFRVNPNEKIKIKEVPTNIPPFYEGKKEYKNLLKEYTERDQRIAGSAVCR